MRTILRFIALFIYLTIASPNGYAQHRATEAFGDGFHLHYRGFTQADHTFFFHHEHIGRAEVQTSHGIQIFPQLFVGTGSGFDLFYYKDGVSVSLPIFVHVRSELLNRRFSPYIDTKVGWLYDQEVTTLTQTVGYHVYFGRSKIGLSLGVGYNLLTNGHECAHGLNTHLALDF